MVPMTCARLGLCANKAANTSAIPNGGFDAGVENRLAQLASESTVHMLVLRSETVSFPPGFR
jgi:hypothetical protein